MRASEDRERVSPILISAYTSKMQKKNGAPCRGKPLSKDGECESYCSV